MYLSRAALIQRRVLQGPLLAQLQVSHVQPLGEADGLIHQPAGDVDIIRDRPARIEVRQAHEVAAEQEAVYEGKRQEANDMSVLGDLDGIGDVT